MASVAMNATTRPYAISRPLTRPAIVPTTIAVNTMPVGPNACVAWVVHQTLVSATSAPTDRSMPPPMMTNVMPMAITPIAADCCSTISSLFHSWLGSRKMRGTVMAPTIQMATSTPTRPRLRRTGSLASSAHQPVRRSSVGAAPGCGAVSVDGFRSVTPGSLPAATPP
jgi:hypothetical protein